MQINRLLVSFGVLIFTLSTLSCTKKASKDPSNTLSLYATAKIKGLDPVYCDDLYSAKQTAYTYEGLLQYHYLKRPYTLIPNLAEALPEISKDRKTITFKIKKGVLFQDDASFKETGGKGRELTAEDFVYSYKRLADPKVMSSGWWIFDGKIVGLNEWREASSKAGQADYSQTIEGLKAVDRYTLQFKLIEPSAQFLYYLAMPFAYAVPREAVEMYGADFIRNPVGTGPFTFSRKESDLNSKIIWTRNPTYRKETYPSEGEAGDDKLGLLEDAGKSLPLSERVVIQIMTESQPQWLSFLAGKLDFSTIPKDNFQNTITPAKDLTPELKSKNIVLHKSPSLDITHLSFNMVDTLFSKNKQLRQAISLAYNIEPVIELFFNGRGVAAQGPIPPGLAGYDPSFKNPFRTFNLDKAKELLAAAGYPGGKGLPELNYATLSDSTARQQAEYFVKSMEALGVKIKVNTYTWPEFQNTVKNKKGQMWGFAWGADYPDAENFLQLFYSKNVSPGPNDANYSNPEFDRLYEESLKYSDSPKRTEIYKKMVKIVVEDAPWIWGIHRLTYTLAHPWLKNMKIHEFDNGAEKYYRVTPH